MDRFYQRHKIPVAYICTEKLASFPLIQRLKNKSIERFESVNIDDSSQTQLVRHMALCRNLDIYFDVIFQLANTEGTSSFVKGNTSILR